METLFVWGEWMVTKQISVLRPNGKITGQLTKIFHETLEGFPASGPDAVV